MLLDFKKLSLLLLVFTQSCLAQKRALEEEQDKVIKENLPIKRLKLESLNEISAKKTIDAILNDLAKLDKVEAERYTKEIIESIGEGIGLLKKAVNDHISITGETFLHKVVKELNENGVYFLIDKLNAKTEAQTNTGLTPLMIACMGFPEIIGFLITNNYIWWSDSAGNTALIYAAMYSENALIQLLKVLSAIHVNHVNHTNKDGDTALTIAAEVNPKAALLLLENAHIDVNHKNEAGYTALEIAVDYICENEASNLEHELLIKKLLKHDKTIVDQDYIDEMFYRLIGFVSIDLLLFLLEFKPNLNYNLGDHPTLHYSTHYKNVDVLKLLLSKPNLDIDIKDSAGYTALMFIADSVSENAVEFANILVNSKINLFATSKKYGKTAYEIALDNDNLKLGQIIAQAMEKENPQAFDTIKSKIAKKESSK